MTSWNLILSDEVNYLCPILQIRTPRQRATGLLQWKWHPAAGLKNPQLCQCPCSLTDTLNPRHVSDLWDLGCGCLGAEEEEDTSEERPWSPFSPAPCLCLPPTPWQEVLPMPPPGRHAKSPHIYHSHLSRLSPTTGWPVDPGTPSLRKTRSVPVSFTALSLGPYHLIWCPGIMWGRKKSASLSHNRNNRYEHASASWTRSGPGSLAPLRYASWICH